MNLIKKTSRRLSASFGVVLSRRLITLVAGVVMFANPVFLAAQSPARQDEQARISISDGDFANLAQEIKSLNDPTFRAFLRAQILTWLPVDGDKLRLQNALFVASDGLADLQKHQDEIFPATSDWLWRSMVGSIKQWSPSESSALARKYPLKINERPKDDPVQNFVSAVAKLNDPKEGNQALERATKAVLDARIPPAILFGQLLQLDRGNSPHLPQILSAVVSLEENQTGSIPLSFLNFLRAIFLKNTTPIPLQVRFLTASVKATRLTPAAFQDPTVRGPASELLAGSLRYIERLAPTQYAEAAGRLQQLNSGGLSNFKSRQSAENRIRQSDRPLEQAITEAEETNDKLFKRDLLEWAARLAKQAGKLGQAVDLMVSATDAEEAKKACAIHSATDEFLGEIIISATKEKDLEISEYAASRMYCPIERANAWRGISVNYYEEQDVVRGQRTMGDAAKSLKEAEDSTEKARASLALAAAFLRFEPANAPEAFSSAVKNINRLRSNKDEEKKFYPSLLPLAKDIIGAFRRLARQDRGAALALAVEIQLAELRASATAGIDSNLRP